MILMNCKKLDGGDIRLHVSSIESADTMDGNARHIGPLLYRM